MNFHYNVAKYRQFIFSLPRNYCASQLEDFCISSGKLVVVSSLHVASFPFPQLSSSEIHVRGI